MSIITEAVKKAQREKESNPLASQEIIRKSVEVEFLKRKQGLNWGPVFVLLVLLLITAPIVAPLFSSPFKKTYQTQSPAVSLASPNRALEPPRVSPKAQFAVEEAPLPKMIEPPSASSFTARPNLLLTGLVYASDADSYCIINDKIVKVGQEVNGAKVISVRADKVTLNYNGEIIELPATGGL